MADKELPYRLVRKVMATSTAASYGKLSLAVLQKPSELALASGRYLKVVYVRDPNPGKPLLAYRKRLRSKRR